MRRGTFKRQHLKKPSGHRRPFRLSHQRCASAKEDIGHKIPTLCDVLTRVRDERSRLEDDENVSRGADFLVELRGFEPMAIVSRPRIAGFRQRLSKEMRGRPDCGRRRSLTVQRPLPDGALMIVARCDRTGDPRRSPFLNRAEPRQGHRYFDCRRKCSLSFSPYPPAACIGQNHSPEGTG